ncbi:MAG: putative FAD-linked oxidoreductase [Syntrophorhabdus sp. PtaB.Bin184]|nr:MAG: putative FAD-linked oxidoreductase [Syntrophorhabdus sp. PtaB.Bin184]
MIERTLIEEFSKIVGSGNILTSEESLKAYSYDGTTTWMHQPDVVLFPKSAEEIAMVVRIANTEKIPVTPRGGGSCLSGGPVPIQGGIVLCTTRMDNILEVDRTAMVAVVEPGVVLMNLNNRLAKEGFFFPPDPQSFLSATIGGVIAENAGGPACVKYGVTKQYVRGIDVVLPTGELITLGGKALCCGAGYDLLSLFVSSEGTLGVITKAIVKINWLPADRKTILAVYDDVAVAGENVYRVLENGVIPGKIELIDNWVINRFEDMMQVGLPRDADAVLIFEVDGPPEAVEVETKTIVEVATKHGAREVRAAKDENEAGRYWAGRRAGFAAVFGAAATVMAEDVTVPRGQIPALINKCRELSKKYDVEIVMLGHAGDGNLHPSILTDISNKEHYGRAASAMDEIFDVAVALGGVISGEHGIGLEKAKAFSKTIDPEVFELMKKVKTFMDPNNIMNPGKIWPQL